MELDPRGGSFGQEDVAGALKNEAGKIYFEKYILPHLAEHDHGNDVFAVTPLKIRDVFACPIQVPLFSVGREGTRRTLGQMF